jgi:hypothetical protein
MRSIKLRPITTVLRYSPTPASRATVRRYYERWRKEKGIPPRCDVQQCIFNTQPLVWLDSPLPLILDHTNGNNLDNSPKNLRYVCPNCDAQLSTRGGANRGRVQEATDGKFVLMSRDGRRHYHLIPEVAHFKITTHPPTVSVTPRKKAR